MRHKRFAITKDVHFSVDIEAYTGFRATCLMKGLNPSEVLGELCSQVASGDSGAMKIVQDAGARKMKAKIEAVKKKEPHVINNEHYISRVAEFDQDILYKLIQEDVNLDGDSKNENDDKNGQ